jgi:hypothetical protein
MRFFRTACAAAILAAAATRADATTITFSDFSSTAGLTLNGSAASTITGDGAVMRLVPANFSQSGSVFSSASINASNFSTAFTFRLTDPGGFCCDESGDIGADGFVFVVQNVSSSIGGGGGGLGYQGIGASAGVEFDTWNNGNDGSTINDSDSNHLGIDTNGSVFSLAQIPVAPNFDNGALWTAWIDYDGTNLEVRTNTTGVRPVAPNLSLALNIPALLGGSTAFVGFSAGTGADFANHDILSWTYSDEFKPGGVDPGASVPEPGTLFLLATGGMALVRRRARARVQ